MEKITTRYVKQQSASYYAIALVCTFLSMSISAANFKKRPLEQQDVTSKRPQKRLRVSIAEILENHQPGSSGIIVLPLPIATNNLTVSLPSNVNNGNRRELIQSPSISEILEDYKPGSSGVIVLPLPIATNNQTVGLPSNGNNGHRGEMVYAPSLETLNELNREEGVEKATPISTHQTIPTNNITYSNQKIAECCKRFSTLKDIAEHTKREHISCYSCEICKQTLTNRTGMGEHYHRMHQGVIKSVIYNRNSKILTLNYWNGTTKTQDMKKPCPYCSGSGYPREYIKEHIIKYCPNAKMLLKTQ